MVSQRDIFGAPTAPRHFERLRAEQVAALYQNVTVGVIGAAIASIILASMLVNLGTISMMKAGLWSSFICLCALVHLTLRYIYTERRPADGKWRFWALAFTCVCFAEGLGWGWASLALVENSRLDLEMLVAVVALTIAGAGIPVFGSYGPAFFVMFVPTTLGCLIWAFQSRYELPQAAAMAWMMVIYFISMIILGVRANINFKELVGLRIRTDELAADLSRQKDIAEQASRAKSSFLAAASHDLRQPVHALSLFAGALRNASIPPESLAIVEYIEASTAAMDGLFSALLDISKLDAGIVEIHKHSFRLDAMLARIERDYVEEAVAKGIVLRRISCAATVYSDPVLVERIVRNLVANAVRYTRTGRVVIGCRRRGGALTVEVWDTGPGIASEHVSQIFQEYFQLENPERDRSKGLGLGLAIVKRLVTLLESDIHLRSRPGHGSCFAVTLPLSTSPPTYSDMDLRSIVNDRASGFILVIDDELAIREATAKLLSGWGYTTMTASSGEEILEHLATCDRRPDLIICDYRLRVGENGLKVIERLHTEYNETIPAMLITGDTAEDRLTEARASGLLLLHKPVTNVKLRAAITNLLTQTALTA